MKLRIMQDAVRLRLNQTEVRALGALHLARMETVFPNQSRLIVTIGPALSDKIEVAFKSGNLAVMIPVDELRSWATGSKVSIETNLKTGDSTMLTLLIEKDFHCLHRKSTDDADTFPHPRGT